MLTVKQTEVHVNKVRRWVWCKDYLVQRILSYARGHAVCRVSSRTVNAMNPKIVEGLGVAVARVPSAQRGQVHVLRTGTCPKGLVVADQEGISPLVVVHRQVEVVANIAVVQYHTTTGNGVCKIVLRVAVGYIACRQNPLAIGHKLVGIKTASSERRGVIHSELQNGASLAGAAQVNTSTKEHLVVH